MTPAPPSEPSVDEAVTVLRRGGIVAFPTETVYGLGADASNADAVARVFAVKGRPATHPLIVHLASAADVDTWAVDIPDSARRLADAFWPGPVTMILRRSSKAVDAVTGGRATIGLRVPRHPVALAMLGQLDGGVAAPSANRFGKVSPTTASHVRADLGGDVDLILDGGPSAVGVESTIVDLSSGAPEVLRSGAVTAEEISRVLDVAVIAVDSRAAPRAPGMFAAHYAPAAEVRVTTPAAIGAEVSRILRSGRRLGVLAPHVVSDLPPDVVELEPAGGADHYATVLYDRLRQADRLRIEVLLVLPPDRVGVGLAVLDRLRRAEAGSRAEGR